MARKITMFELHVDGVQIGPARLGGRRDEEGDGEDVAEERGDQEAVAEDVEGPRPEEGGSPVPRVLAVVGGIVVGVAVGRRVVRRVRGRGRDIEIDTVTEPEEPIDVVEEQIAE
jgi:hypothetical protein